MVTNLVAGVEMVDEVEVEDFKRHIKGEIGILLKLEVDLTLDREEIMDLKLMVV